MLKTANDALSPNMPPDVRADVVQAIFIAILEGKISPREIGTQAKTFVTAHYRMFDQHKMRSTDEVIPGTDNLRMIDTLASDVEHF